MRRLGFVVLLVGIAACVPRRVPAPVVTSPRFPEFVTPVVPREFAGTPTALRQDRGWRFLQTADLKNAEREFDAALKAAPAFYPANTGLGYVELAKKEAESALPHFDRALERQRGYAPALAGRGQALLALNREADALAAFEAAVAADPSLADLGGRIEVLRFRSLEGNLSRARDAMREGRLDEALSAYSTAMANSPESPVLYRELAGVERQSGDVERALEHYRKAVALDSTDARSLVQIGDLLDAKQDMVGAEKAYSEALALEPNEEVEAKRARARARVELARLPAEYRAIEQATEITRADLAALIGVRFAPLLQASRRRDAAVITDIRGTWAATWIMAVARAGVVEPFPNHAFQPRTIVRRIDLAQAVSRLLARVAANDPAKAKAWQSARLTFADLAPGHLQYLDALAAVASGVMEVGPDNSFQPSRATSGAEAIEALSRLEALAGAASAAKEGDR
jgi:tetratricopeptide (TPR) repeat protein